MCSVHQATYGMLGPSLPPPLSLTIKSKLSVEIERSHSYNNNSSHITGTASIRIFYVISIAANSISRSKKKQQVSHTLKKSGQLFRWHRHTHRTQTFLTLLLFTLNERKEQGIQTATVTITSANLFNVWVNLMENNQANLNETVCLPVCVCWAGKFNWNWVRY